MEFRTVRTRSLLSPKWYRHPIVWWKLRHWRKDVRDYYENRTPIQEEFDRKVEEALFYGENAP